MKLQYLPNIITFIRLVLIVPLCLALLTGHFIQAFFILILAGFSDGLDGVLARAFNWQSKLGAIIDPLADKLLMLTTFTTLTWLAIIPTWLFMLVIGRDLIIMMGVFLYKHLVEEPYYKASWISKINTGLQIIFVVLLLFNAAFMPMSVTLIHFFMYAMAITTVVSLIDYVIVWANKAFKIWKLKQI